MYLCKDWTSADSVLGFVRNYCPKLTIKLMNFCPFQRQVGTDKVEHFLMQCFVVWRPALLH